MNSNYQSVEPTFLKKYSYICISENQGIVRNSTCFFYKNGSKIFLINNYHSLTGVDVFSGRKIFDVDTLQVIYPKLNSSLTAIMKIPIKLDKIEYLKFYDKPDLIGYQITPPKDAIINYINKFIDINYLDKKPEEVISYGYPAQLQSWKSISQTLLKGSYEDDFKALEDLLKLDISKMPEKEMPNIITKVKKLNFFISTLSESGRSGSPIFGKFVENKNGETKYVYKFIGVIFGSEEHIKKTWAIKGSVVNNYFINNLF